MKSIFSQTRACSLVALIFVTLMTVGCQQGNDEIKTDAEISVAEKYSNIPIDETMSFEGLANISTELPKNHFAYIPEDKSDGITYVWVMHSTRFIFLPKDHPKYEQLFSLLSDNFTSNTMVKVTIHNIPIDGNFPILNVEILPSQKQKEMEETASALEVEENVDIDIHSSDFFNLSENEAPKSNHLVYTGESFLIDKYCMSVHSKDLDIEYDSTTPYDWSQNPFADRQLNESRTRYVYDLQYLERDFSYVSSYCTVDWERSGRGGVEGYMSMRNIANFSKDEYEKDIKFVIDALIEKDVMKIYEREDLVDDILFYTPFNRAKHVYYGFNPGDRILGKAVISDSAWSYLYDYQLYASWSDQLVLDITYPNILEDWAVLMEENVYMK